MRKLILIALAVVLVLALGAGAVWAQNGIRASKATAKVSELTLLEWTSTNTSWDTILTQNIKTPNQKDLFIGVSLETGLYTRTLVRSKVKETEPLGDWDTSKARARVLVRVGVDGNYATVPVGEAQQPGVAFPRAVTFNDREQTLSAKFMGIFTGACLIVDPITHAVSINYTCLEPEELELILNTLSANSFNFVVADLTPGNHVITVEAKIETNGAAEEGAYEAMAMVGQGSVVIELVRMMKGEDYLDIPE